MGVWIEMEIGEKYHGSHTVTPCVGVWIEIQTVSDSGDLLHVTPCVWVWIEISDNGKMAAYTKSLPACGCGLK